MDSLVTITLPGPSASRSKMQKKGWKCWAKNLTSVKSPASSGYDYEGDFLAVDTPVEVTLGDLILHVDDSSEAAIGIVVPNSMGKAVVLWISSASGKWAGSLAKQARLLVALGKEDRIIKAAEHRVSLFDADDTAEVRAYYLTLAGMPAEAPAATEATPVEPVADAALAFDARAIADKILALLAGLSDEQVEQVYLLLPGVEAKQS